MKLQTHKHPILPIPDSCTFHFICLFWDLGSCCKIFLTQDIYNEDDEEEPLCTDDESDGPREVDRSKLDEGLLPLHDCIAELTETLENYNGDLGQVPIG